MPTDFDFRQARVAPGGPIALVFGREDQTSTPDAVASLSIALRPPTLGMLAHYFIDVVRPFTGTRGLAWEPTTALPVAPQGAWGTTAALRTTAADAWQQASALTSDTANALHTLRPARSAANVRWDVTAPVDRGIEDGFRDLLRQQSPRIATWVIAEPRAALTLAEWQVPTHHPLAHQDSWVIARPNHLSHRFTWQSARWRTERRTLPWQDGRHAPPGKSPPLVFPNQPPPPDPRLSPVDLDLRCVWRGQDGTTLRFTHRPCRGRTRQIPALKVYLVSHDVSIVRLPGREPVPATLVQLAIDADAWSWDMSARLPLTALPLIEPTAAGPVELEISIDGLIWIVLVEDYDLRREFGASSLTVRGRSRAAWLAEPYAPICSYSADTPATARQLAEQELARIDLATGFTLDWQLPDWLIPAGVWSYQGLAPLAAILRIVDSVGGTLQSHPKAWQLSARSRYPSLPWQWNDAEPDIALPLDAVRSMQLRWKESPTYNAVFVAGERQGVVGRVIRRGSAGNYLAPMVVDPLITHADAARERGRRLLADSGRQARVTLELPLLPSLGLLEPGRLIAVGDGTDAWRGLVRGTQFVAQWNDALTVRQTIELERHYGA